MLLIIDSQLHAEVTSLCNNAPLIRFRCLTNLLQAHADGKHIAVIHPSICRTIEDCERFSEEHRVIAKKIRNKYYELAELPSILQTHARLCIDGDDPILTDGIWSIPVNWLATYGFSEANLICEDLYDCIICQEAANDFLALNGLNSIRLQLDHTPGGGGNTHRVLKSKAIESQKVSICVVDSDKESPDDTLQPESTAGKCMELQKSGIYEIFVSTGREIENHIPSRLLDKVHLVWDGDKPSNTCTRLNRNHAEITSFSDMKSGLKKWNIDSMIGVNRIYWEGVQHALAINPICCPAKCQAKNSGDCSTTILQPIGRSLLRVTGEYLLSQATNPKRYNDYLPSPNDSFWKTMGAAVAAYCVAPKTAGLM